MLRNDSGTLSVLRSTVHLVVHGKVLHLRGQYMNI